MNNPSTYGSSQLSLFELSDDPKEVEKILENARAFALEWGEEQHGSAQEFVQAMQAEFGPKIRMYLVEIVGNISKEKGLPFILRQYFDATLSHEDLTEALGSKPGRKDEEQSSLDELFQRSIRLQASKKYAEAIAFVSKLPKYSPYNNMLVYLQNPNATFWATAARWKKDFRRTIKEDSRPMLILAPMTPVLMVYDVLDTEGRPLPEWFSDSFRVEGGFDASVLDRTLKNSLDHDAINVVEKDLGLTHGGSAIRFDPNKEVKMRIVLKKGLDNRARYAILCHELAHIFLGHLGSDEDKWWPSRLNLTRNQREMEAESVAFIVCSRAGLISHSAEYLAGYIKDEQDISKISIDMITKVAGRIENMGQRAMPKRSPKAAE